MTPTAAPPERDATPAQAWTATIDARGAPAWRQLREAWAYRDLLLLLARRDLVTMYKQTVLGPLWYVLQPLLTALLFAVIFSRVARLPTDGVPALLFYLSGVVYWNFFAESVRATADSFVANAALFQKVYFPRVVVPAAKVTAGVAKFAIQLLLLGGFYAYYAAGGHVGPTPGWGIVAVAPLALGAGALGLGCGLLVSSLTYKYRDLQYLVAFGIQLLMYATPVIYPLSSAPERIAAVLAVNPMSAYVEAFRRVVLGVGTVTASGLLYSAAATVAIVTLGAYRYTRAERTFADTV